MTSKREQVLSALLGQLRTIPMAAVKRNEALPQAVPAAGLPLHSAPSSLADFVEDFLHGFSHWYRAAAT